VTGTAAALLALLVAQAGEGGWRVASRTGDVEVQERARAGARVREVRTVAVVDAPPAVVRRVVTDYGRYVELMPYTEEGRVVATEEGGRVTHFYTLVNPPLVSRRDYTMRMVEEGADASGALVVAWTPSERGPAPRPGVVRVTVNEGSWRLEPVDGGARTRATYQLFTDPGGSLPGFVADRANREALPGVLQAVRRAAADPRYREPAPPR
jgi:hypothetical protein